LICGILLQRKAFDCVLGGIDEHLRVMFLRLFDIFAFLRFIGKFFGFFFLDSIIGFVLSSVDYHLLAVFARHIVGFFQRTLLLSDRDRVLGFNNHFFVDLVYVSRRNDKLFLIYPLQVTFDCIFRRVHNDILVFVFLQLKHIVYFFRAFSFCNCRNNFGVVFLDIHNNIFVLLFG
jgi:hypothetical protein